MRNEHVTPETSESMTKDTAIRVLGTVLEIFTPAISFTCS